MKLNYLLLHIFSLLLALPTLLHAQIGFNSPAGVTPKRDVEMYSRNGFLIQQKYIPTSDVTFPTYTMSCPGAAVLTTQTGILLDPGGTGNYLANQNCTQVVSGPGAYSVGYEIVFDLLNTEANGDSVVIISRYQGRIAFSGNTLPTALVSPGSSFTVLFKSDNDANTGPGFQLRWRKVIIDSQATDDPNFGNALHFDLDRGSLVSGLHGVGTAQNTGYYSTNLGYINLVNGSFAIGLGSTNTVSKEFSVAIGNDNSISGSSAVALGSFNKISGEFGMVVGTDNTVNQQTAITIGASNTASAYGAIVVGYNSISSGTHSVALGNSVSTNGLNGAFILGDNSTFTKLNNTAADQFMARFSGGYRLFSNTAATFGVQLNPGATAWSTLSDSTRKERFLPLNHTDLLANIRTLRLGTWNYKGQRDQRHYGPMAQDFFARFGHDALGVIGSDTLLNSHDFTAITLSGVQALALENEQLKARIVQLERERAQTISRLDALERRVFIQPAPRTTLANRRKRAH